MPSNRSPLKLQAAAVGNNTLKRECLGGGDWIMSPWHRWSVFKHHWEACYLFFWAVWMEVKLVGGSAAGLHDV